MTTPLSDIEQNIINFLKETDDDPTVNNDFETLLAAISVEKTKLCDALASLEKNGFIVKSQIYTVIK
jgi:hypothetical protein